MNFKIKLNEFLEEINKIEDYNSENYNVEYAIVSFITDKECPENMLARNIVFKISNKDIIDRVKCILDSCY